MSDVVYFTIGLNLAMNQPQKFVDLIEKLIRDARVILASARGGFIEDREALRRWSNELILLRNLGGTMLSPWARRLAHDGVLIPVEYVQRPLAALETVKYATDNGLLTSYRDLVIAEAFTDLYEQGQYLFSQGYFLAAGVIFRAVLEERLRELCLAADCMPEKERPTLGDLNQALFRCESVPYDKAMMLHVTALAAVGNDAAHNSDSLQKEDVERLMRGTLEFLSRYSST
ncbi:MAG TPA: hypothetical protein PLN96_08260 [Zoogloea sp.]|uniref:hypothetical protein n=1 Tax=Betaproteobacteria TaxID=28216 RepID=UPI002C84BF8A|nr:MULTISPECIES: hypothetical protein [Betaproteobacteria]HMV17568.1 hypothetical protein [Rhodocyclaceae bacterium]HMW57630.1 hypothetical protein [Accumulibacter sp.]HNB64788.1 hypothetical protein [Rhodocyclaceae bacterium]HNI47841.1 hypothetical protein [Zoogloea sp.]